MVDVITFVNIFTYNPFDFMAFRHTFLLFFLLCAASSCIKNDLPYPVVTVEVLGIEGDGFTVSGNDIDKKNRVVTLRLDETTDISKVKITEVSLTEGGTSSVPLIGVFDLRTPLSVTLSLYQDYEWTLRAEQTIERKFAVEGQVGASVFDLERRTVSARVSLDADLTALKVTELKLGPRDITTTNPTMEELTDFSSARTLEVTYHDVHEQWTLDVTHTDIIVALVDADLWANTATLSIAAQPEATSVVLNYKRSADTDWRPTTVAPNSDGTYTATITPTWQSGTNDAGLEIHTIDASTGVFAGGTYDFQLIVDGATHTEGTFTTNNGSVIPFGGMEDSAMSCFTVKNETSDSWASGNNNFTKTLCTQGEFNGMGGSYCAKLTAGTTLSLLASGNLFTGTFNFVGTTGTVGFGQPYTWDARPTSLKVKYYAEKIGTVDVAKHPGAPIGKDEQDVARIMVAIVDWNARHNVASGLSAPTGIWDPTKLTSTDEGQIIAYGSMFIDSSSTGEAMIQATIPLHYYDQTTKPSGQYSLVISCSTSAYGDYMVGCKSNVMYVDDFEWGY